MKGFCYAIIFTNGRCKYGMTSVPDKRFSAHKASAMAHGVEISYVALSPAVNEPMEVEKEILTRADRAFSRAGGEGSEMFDNGNAGQYISIFTQAVEGYTDTPCMVGNHIESSKGIGARVVGSSSEGGEKKIGSPSIIALKNRIIHVISKTEGCGLTIGRIRNQIRNVKISVRGFEKLADELVDEGLLEKRLLKNPRGRPSVRYYNNDFND